MARMPALAGGLLMAGLALTAGCQTATPKKAPPVPTAWNTTPKNNQVAGGNNGPNNPGPSQFPKTPIVPTSNQQPGGNLNLNNTPGTPNLVNPGNSLDGPTPLILPGNRNSTTTIPNFPQDPPLLAPPSTNTPQGPMIRQ